MVRATQPTTEVQPGIDTDALRRLLPPYAVILHNDDVNEMLYVVHALLESVPELSVEQATEIMLEAHHQGRAQVIVCPKERAELYRERLERRGLTATIEPA
jgi:ATP-dependent Clp protease adaptor protein ClpS